MKFPISVIIPVHKGQNKNIFRACLLAILRAKPALFELILVSDGEKVPIPEGVDASGIIHLATGVQSGPAVARNLGAKHAKGDILWFIDSDVVVPAGLAEAISLEFQNHPKMDALFGSYDTAPFMPNFLSQYRNLLHHYVHQKGREDAFTFWSGCGAIRREAFLEAGGFDGERFPEPSIEDIDLGYRLKSRGYSIRLCKHLQVTHLKKWEAFSMIKVDFFKRALPWTKLLLRQQEMANDLNLKLSDRLSVAAVFLLPFLLFASIWMPGFAAVSLLVFLFFLALNIELYLFFYRHRGLGFALRSIPWHGLFYLISGLAFALGTAEHYLASQWTPFYSTDNSSSSL